MYSSKSFILLAYVLLSYLTLVHFPLENITSIGINNAQRLTQAYQNARSSAPCMNHSWGQLIEISVSPRLDMSSEQMDASRMFIFVSHNVNDRRI